MTQENERAGSVDSVVVSLLQAVRAQVVTLVSSTRLAWAELRLVASYTGLLVALMVIFAGMSLIAWMLILVFGVLLLANSGFSLIQALLIVFTLHMCALIGLVLLIRRTLNAINFKHTRKALGTKIRDGMSVEGGDSEKSNPEST